MQTERATCHDFSRIFGDREEPERACFTKRAYHSASYRALETGPNGLQKLEPAYQTRLHASLDACVTSVKSAPSPFARNEGKSRKITEIPQSNEYKGGKIVILPPKISQNGLQTGGGSTEAHLVSFFFLLSVVLPSSSPPRARRGEELCRRPLPRCRLAVRRSTPPAVSLHPLYAV